MKKIIQRMLKGILSLITTFLIMAAPIAAMVYASAPDIAVESFSIKDQTVSMAEKNAQVDSVLTYASSKHQTAGVNDDEQVLTEKE